MELVYIFGRLIFSITSNVYQKKLSHSGLHPFYIVATTYFVLSLLAVTLLGVISIGELSHAFLVNVLLASILDVGGWMFLVMSLSKTDISVFGPLNAYKVIFSLLLAVIFLNEIPSTQGLIGVFIIIIGSFFLTPPAKTVNANRILSLLKDKGVQARFVSIALFSVGTIFLKNSVVDGGPLATLVY